MAIRILYKWQEDGNSSMVSLLASRNYQGRLQSREKPY